MAAWSLNGNIADMYYFRADTDQPPTEVYERRKMQLGMSMMHGASILIFLFCQCRDFLR